MRMVTAPVGAKAQITLPKAVREALRLSDRNGLIGFVIQGDRVAITRVEPVPSSDPFSDAEWHTIDQLAAQPPTATLQNSEQALQYLQRHLRVARSSRHARDGRGTHG